MSNTQHTPGPWRYFEQGDSTRFIVTARPSTLPGNSREDFAQVDIQHEADARLIAAAPELLAALRIELAALMEQRDTGTTMLSRDARIERMRAALAKVQS